MSFRDIATWTDAIAIAPYFGHSFLNAPDDEPTMADLERLFVKLEAARVNALARVKENKQTAEEYGKRLIAYEGGQHVVPGNMAAQGRSTLPCRVIRGWSDPQTLPCGLEGD